MVPANQELPRKKEKPVIVSAARSIDGSYSEATSIKFDPHVSGGAYQNVRKVTTEWNARPKHWCSPGFRGRKHQTRPSTLFSPIFSLAREKMGPPEARQKRPRRNESLQARLLILCARFFLSKPQTEFAVWVFLCKSATTSQSRLRRASSHARGALFIPPAAASPCAADNIHIPSHLPAPTRSGSPPRCRPRRRVPPADTPAPRARRAR